MEERRQKRDPIFRSPPSIDTSTPRFQPDQRHQPSLSSPTYSPAVSPSCSDHSTSRGFYSPRGGEDEDEVDDEDDDVDEDERGYLYRPRSPVAVEMPVISTVSRSVRVEPKAVTRVDSGVKERDYVERRVVEEDGGLVFSGGGGGGRGSVRRKWEGRNTVVYNSGLKENEVVSEMSVVEEESSEWFRGREVFESGAKGNEFVVEESMGFGGRRGRKSNVFVPHSGVNEEDVVGEGNVELGDRRGRKAKAIVSDSNEWEKEDVVRVPRVAEEGSMEFRDDRGQKSNVFKSDPNEKEEVARGKRVLKEGVVGFRDRRGVGVRLEARNVMVLDSSPKLVYESRPTVEVEGTKTVVYEAGRMEEEGFDRARVMEEGGGGGEGVDGVKPSFRREDKSSEVLFMRKTALLLRIISLFMCVISFSIMATNKNNGWALDSFDRYKEFRYCMAVSILGFMYSVAQAFDLAYHLSTDKYINQHSQLRYYLNFFMDQALSYLLISASSSAATRIEDWVSNWGKDKFPQIASASVIISFIAFVSFAFSSLVSGYILCSINAS